jgi:putative CocE/NonD family hydrolase
VHKEKLYFHQNKSLVFNKPAVNKKNFDEYISDPASPVPYTQKTTQQMSREYMVEDQSFAAKRNDVLTFETGLLLQDVTIAGPITANLFVSTSGTDADWVVKVIDVFPDSAKTGSYEMLVRGDIIRGKYRNSYSNPEPFFPNKVTKVTLPLQDILHTFKKGHRIMVQVQSSWFPLADRNPQKFENIYFANDSDFQKATQRLYFSEQYPSDLDVLILK